jgi:hypothetical protein
MNKCWCIIPCWQILVPSKAFEVCSWRVQASIRYLGIGFNFNILGAHCFRILWSSILFGYYCWTGCTRFACREGSQPPQCSNSGSSSATTWSTGAIVSDIAPVDHVVHRRQVVQMGRQIKTTNRIYRIQQRAHRCSDLQHFAGGFLLCLLCFLRIS